MKIAFHDNSISLRGTTVALYDYAYYTRKLIGNESIILYDKNHPANDVNVHIKFLKEFNIYGYNNKSEIDEILYKEDCSHFYSYVDSENVRDEYDDNIGLLND